MVHLSSIIMINSKNVLFNFYQGCNVMLYLYIVPIYLQCSICVVYKFYRNACVALNSGLTTYIHLFKQWRKTKQGNQLIVVNLLYVVSHAFFAVMFIVLCCQHNGEEIFGILFEEFMNACTEHMICKYMHLF